MSTSGSGTTCLMVIPITFVLNVTKTNTEEQVYKNHHWLMFGRFPNLGCIKY